MPDLLVWTLMSPIMFVLLFAYVFGSAIDVPGGNYREFLMAGIFAQTVIFGATFTGAGLAEDMQKGVIDRFRSLPMSRSAVLIGRTASDIATNALSIMVIRPPGRAPVPTSGFSLSASSLSRNPSGPSSETFSPRFWGQKGEGESRGRLHLRTPPGVGPQWPPPGSTR